MNPALPNAAAAPAGETILVRGVNWLGDAVMSVPALQRLRQAKPRARITLLAPEKLAGLWEGQSFLDDLLLFSPKDSLWKTARRLRERQFSTAVAFPNSLRSALELWLARIPQRAGYARPGRTLFLTNPVPPREGARPMRQRSVGEIRQLLVRSPGPPTTSTITLGWFPCWVPPPNLCRPASSSVNKNPKKPPPVLGCPPLTPAGPSSG